MVIKEVITFKSNLKRVWDLVTNPEMTKQYMFGCEILSDWKIGNPVTWKGKIEEGKEVVYVKGEIIEYEKERKVTFSTFDPNMGIADVSANYVNLTYELIPQENGCKLIITQGDFQGVDNSEKRFEEAKQGWKMVLPMMEKIIAAS